MSGIIAVYSLVVAVLISSNMKPPPTQQYSLFNGFMHLACGLSVGLTGVAAGYAIGVVGDSVRMLSGIMITADVMLGCASVHATIAHLCGHGPDPHLRRGAGSLWVS